MMDGKESNEINYLTNVLLNDQPLTGKEKVSVVEIIRGLPSKESKQNYMKQLGQKIKSSR